MEITIKCCILYIGALSEISIQPLTKGSEVGLVVLNKDEVFSDSFEKSNVLIERGPTAREQGNSRIVQAKYQLRKK